MVSTPMEYILGAILGVSIGTLGGFAGIGGAPFFVAGLTLMLGYEQHLAQGTIVAVMLGPMSLPGCIVMWDRVVILKWYILSGVLTYACFSYVGATISYWFDSNGMKFLFGILVLILGSRNIIKSMTEACGSKVVLPPANANADDTKDGAATTDSSDVKLTMLDQSKPSPAATEKDGYVATPSTDAADLTTTDAGDLTLTAVALGDEETGKAVEEEESDYDELGMYKHGITVSPDSKYKFSLVTASLLGVLVGTVGGLFGIGAGVLIVPMLTAIWGIHKDDARAMSLGILCPPVSLGAVIRYQAEGDIKWPMVALQFCCYVICNYFGAKAGKKVDTIVFNRVLGGMLFVLGVVLIALAINTCGDVCF